jgi:type IV secretory pathway VirB10-like protein
VREAEMLALMKEDLKALRDIPECQMSTERMRQAILNQGLKPKHPLGWLSKNWGYLAGAAACTFALAMILPRLNQNQSDSATGIEPGTNYAAQSATESGSTLSAVEPTPDAAPSSGRNLEETAPAALTSSRIAPTPSQTEQRRRATAPRPTGSQRTSRLANRTRTPIAAPPSSQRQESDRNLERVRDLAGQYLASAGSETTPMSFGASSLPGASAPAGLGGNSLIRRGGSPVSIILIDTQNSTQSGTGQATPSPDGDILFGG